MSEPERRELTIRRWIAEQEKNYREEAYLAAFGNGVRVICEVVWPVQPKEGRR